MFNKTITNEEKFAQLTQSNQTLINVANNFLDIKKSGKSESSESDADSYKLIQDIIKGANEEITKIKKKEFTIAVVGEVKAGKSTFINALIGYDISHSRSKAATTYPVRIKHKKAHNKSSIKLNVSSSFWSHVKTIKNQLQSNNFTDEPRLVDFKNTIEYIKSGNFTQQNYNQDNLEIEEVRTLLEMLHDLPRVSSIIFNNADNKNNDVKAQAQTRNDKLRILTDNVIPEISLEFPTIKLFADNQEGVVLIDTPGLGEGSEISMFISDTIKTEITKASAVMVVLEKGGRGSASEKNIEGIIELASSLYVIAGKMDDYNNDNNDMDIAEKLTNIANTYKKYNFQQAFAISQYKAVQGIKVKDYLETHGKLENPHVYGSNFKKHPSYDILEIQFGRSQMKQIDEQKDGYEDLLKADSVEINAILEEDFINCKGFEFSKITDEFKDIASTVMEKLLSTSRTGISKKSYNLKEDITRDLNTISKDAKEAEKTYKLMEGLKKDMDSLNSDMENKIKHQNQNATTFKNNIHKDTMSKLTKLINEFKNNIDEDDLEDNEPISFENANKFNSLFKIKTEEPARDAISRNCQILVDDMQNKAINETKTLQKEYQKISQDIHKKLAKINDQLTEINDQNTNISPEHTQSINFNTYTGESNKIASIDQMAENCTEKKDRQISNSRWYNPLSWGTTKTKYYTELNADQFYAQLEVNIENIIEKTFNDIKQNINESMSKVKIFKDTLKDKIDSRLSTLKDMKKYEDDVKLATETKEKYTAFIKEIDRLNHIIKKL